MKNFTQFEQAMSDLIDQFFRIDFIAQQPDSYYAARMQWLAEQMQNQEFRITVVGEFSAGKSTFLNAIIGRDILPHAVTETTATVTYIHNVPAHDPMRDQVVVRFTAAEQPEVILDIAQHPEALKEYVTTESRTVQVAKEIRSVDVYVHIKDMEERVVFVDTPGLNGVADGHRELTLHEIKQAHASICLFHVRSLSQSNLEFLKVLAQHQRSFLFVLNFIDELKISEGETVELKLQALRQELQENMWGDVTEPSTKMRVFGLSALKALAAKDNALRRLYSGDTVDLTKVDRERIREESRFAILEEALWNEVLRGEKQKIFTEFVINSFQSLLQEVLNYLNDLLKMMDTQVSAGESEQLSMQVKQLEATQQKNWDKVFHFIQSRISGLEKVVKEQLEVDLEQLIAVMESKIPIDDFGKFESFMKDQKLSKHLQENIYLLREKYNAKIADVLEEIYQSAILRIQAYHPEIEIDIRGKLKFQQVEFAVDGFDYLNKIQTIHEKQHKFEGALIENRSETEKIESRMEELHQKLNKQQPDLQRLNTNLQREQASLGPEPSVVRRSETRTRYVERSRFNPMRWLGNTYREEQYEVTVNDDTARVQWRNRHAKLQQDYRQKQDELMQKYADLKLDQKRLLNQKQERDDERQRLEKRLASTVEQIRQADIEFQEFIEKAQKEYLLKERKRLMEVLERSVKTNIRFQFIESMQENIRTCAIDVLQVTESYYQKSYREFQAKLLLLHERTLQETDRQDRQAIRASRAAMENVWNQFENLTQQRVEEVSR